MRIPALDLVGVYHLKLSALEQYFTELADIGSQQPPESYLPEKAATARSLDQLRHFRLEFEALRQKHRDAIEQSLAGERPVVHLSAMEATLVESISEMHSQIWQNRLHRQAS